MYKHCYISYVAEPDLLDSSYYRPVFKLLADMDADIAGLYAEAGIEGVRTRFVGPLIDLDRRGPMTIKELAGAREVSHSAMSQTVAAMRKADLVEPAEGPDGRTRRVRLTERSQRIVPFLRAEWRATEATVRALDAELRYPLLQAVADLNAALATRSFAQRLRDNLAAQPPVPGAALPEAERPQPPAPGEVASESARSQLPARDVAPSGSAESKPAAPGDAPHGAKRSAR
jgi:DNA-binding MarR family transcriptional regulator